MSGKFDIGEDFNVFDEWGNYVGKFTPRGGSADGFIAIIAVIFLWVFGFAIYLIFKMIKNGFKALVEGRWIAAIFYLSPIWITLFAVTFAITSASASAIPSFLSELKNRQEQEILLQKIETHLAEADQAEGILLANTPYGEVKVRKLKGLYTASNIRSCKGYAIDECEQYFLNNRGFWAYEITIPISYGVNMSSGTNFGFPDRFFAVKNNGYGESYHCFLEAWGNRAFQPEIYQNTNPAIVYCEARSDNNVKLELWLTEPGNWRAEPYNLNLILDPFTGLFDISK